MEASFVSRARTAINSAAAKAEKVLTDIKKSDAINHRDLDKQSPDESTPEPRTGVDEPKDSDEVKNKKVKPRPLKIKPDWHERIRNIRIGKRGAVDNNRPENSPMAFAIFDDNLYLMGEKEFSLSKDSVEGAMMEGSKSMETDIIPSSAIVKHLAVAIEAGLNYNSMKDLLASNRDSSPIRERASKSISAVKSLVLREKEDKLGSEFGTDEQVLSVINVLLNAEGRFRGRTISGLEEAQIKATSLLRDIHGAPVDSFVVKLSEAVGCFKTMRKMASFWSRVISELRRLWYEGQYIPGVPPDNIPDLNSCLLYQQLQVINCCISRKKHHTAAVETLESVTARASSNAEESSDGACPLDRCFYARTKSGELVLRLGADKECKNLAMLETGEPIYAPVVQEPPLLTEDLIKETEEFVLRTGSVGAGCSQLLADMQAFKAANPGSILEDFVRWHSPPDWVENDSTDSYNTSNGDDSCVKGQLSQRMQKEGNLWRELWDTSKPVPAVRQAPLYDEDLAVEGILDYMEEMPPSDLFKQLFIALLGSGLVIADAILSSNPSLSNLFDECKNFVITASQSNAWVEKLDNICQVYETIEAMILNPDEVVNITAQQEETTAAGELRNHFKKLTFIFGGKNKPLSKDSKNNNEESPARQQFSLFSKRPPKPAASPSSGLQLEDECMSALFVYDQSNGRSSISASKSAGGCIYLQQFD